ncbi:MAG: hypothetical protein COB85_00070 [Bacteroidetes bacterium]|nr:MAG: hypothetical protein COB85_00070 [Bacteroidota bacterium]
MFLSAFAVQGQDQNAIDSLKSIIETGKPDTSICNAYLSWGEEIYNNDPDTALILWQKALDLAQGKLLKDPLDPLLKKRYSYFYAEALNNIGYIYSRRGNVGTALHFYHKSLKINEEIGNSSDPSAARAGKIRVATSLNNIGSAYNTQGDIPQALTFYLKSLRVLEALGVSPDSSTAKYSSARIATSLNNIGYTYEAQGDIPKALDFYHRSLRIREKIGAKKGVANSLNNIGYIYDKQDDKSKALEYYRRGLILLEDVDDKNGIAYTLNNMASVYRKNGDLDKALKLYQKSLKLQKELGYLKGIGLSLNNIGLIYKKQGDFIKALEFYHKSLRIREDIGDKTGISYSLNNIGVIELKRNELSNAHTYASRGLEIAREIGSPRLISFNAYLLSKVAKKYGNYNEALEMYELHILMRDSTNNEETQKATIRQQTKYEFEKAQLVKEQEEKEAARLEAEVTSRRDNLQYSVILIAILVLFGGVLSLGFVNVSVRMAEGIIFFSFLILFEFLLVLADPYIDRWSGGAPGLKLLFNAGIAALIFPAHAFFESRLKGGLVNSSA